MMSAPRNEHVHKAVKFLRSLRPQQRPGTTTKLAGHLQRKGCCKVHVRVQPGELACALAAEKSSQCRNFAQPFADAACAHGKNIVNETSDLALDCAKSAAVRFHKLEDAFVQSICSPGMQCDKAAQWLCAQSSSLVIVHPAALVEELCARGFLKVSTTGFKAATDAMADRDRVIYDEIRLAEEVADVGIDCQPWNHQTWLEDLLSCDAAQKAFEAACPKKPDAKADNWLPTWPYFSHRGQQVKLISTSLGCILQTDIANKRIKIQKLGQNSLPSSEVLRALQFVISPSPAFQCRFQISSDFAGTVLGKQGTTLRLLESRFGIRLMLVASDQKFDKIAKVTEETPQVKSVKHDNTGLSWAAIAARGATSSPSLTGSTAPRTFHATSASGPKYKLVGWLGAEAFARLVGNESGSLATAMQDQVRQKAEQLTQELKEMFERYSANQKEFAHKKKNTQKLSSGRRQAKRAFKNHIAQQKAWFDGGA